MGAKNSGPAGSPLPPVSSLAPRFERVGDVALLLGERAVVHQRADIGVGEAGPDGECRGGLSEAAAEIVIDRPLDEEAVGGQAILARGHELCLDRFGDGAVEVGIGEDDEGGVAAEFEHEMLDGLGRLAKQQPADLGRAGEGEHAHAGVLGPGGDDLGGAAGDDVEDAGGHAGTLGEHGKGDRRERRLMGGMGHRRAAGGERRGGLAGEHRRREVPRRHQRGHPGRLAPYLDLGAGKMRGDALDVGALGLLGIELDEGGGIVDLAAGFRERLALFHGHDGGEVVARCGGELEPPAQRRGALLRQQRRPGGKGGSGGVDRGARIRGGKCGDVTDHRTARRVGDGKLRALVEPDLPAADDRGAGEKRRVRQAADRIDGQAWRGSRTGHPSSPVGRKRQ